MSNIYLPGEEGNGKSVSRRRFLIGSGALAGAAALFGVSHLTPNTLAGIRLASAQSLDSDLDILQFALTLEHLENAAYRAANNSGLLSGEVADYFRAFGDHENTHVVALTDVITKMGAEPAKAQSSYNLPTFSNQGDVVSFFAIVEEVGAGAYLGAAPLVKDLGILAAAAAIHNVEAQHASVLKAVLNDPLPSPAFGSPLTLDQVLAAVTPLLSVGAVPGGMPTTGAPNMFGPLMVAAGVGAAALGAAIHIRSRKDSQMQEETEQA